MEDATGPPSVPSATTESVEFVEKQKKPSKPHPLHTNWSFYSKFQRNSGAHSNSCSETET